MADHVWTVVCSKTLTDPSTNVVSLIDVTEKLILHTEGSETVDQSFEKAKGEGSKGIVFPVRFQLVTWWVRSDFAKSETAEIRIAFVNPEGKRLFQQDAGLNLEDNAGQRLTVNFEALPITSLGRFWFLVEQAKASRGAAKKWVTAAKVPLELAAGT